MTALIWFALGTVFGFAINLLWGVFDSSPDDEDAYDAAMDDPQ